MRFDEILSHANAKKKTKRHKGFRFRAFIGCFKNDIMAAKGLIIRHVFYKRLKVYKADHQKQVFKEV